MGIFDKIKDAIFGHAAAAGAAPVPGSSPSPGSTPAASASGPVAAAGIQHQTTTGPAVGTPSPKSVDVVAVLDSLAAKQQTKLDWRHSIVDLLKLLSLDSSLAHRQALAKELGYSGDTGDSASMNIWLHREVMRSLAQNGGAVPAELR